MLPYGSVRVIAVLPMYMETKELFCNLKYDDNIVKVMAKEVAPIHEHFDMKFAAFIVLCVMTIDTDERVVKLPNAVALSYIDDTFSRMEVFTFVPIR